jgi:four helix bundle protein
MHFDHERLDVYAAAIDFVALAHQTSATLPPGHGHLSDQLRRAATSIVLNIAEGAGEFSSLEKARFYRMARRSATECAGVVDVAARLDLLDQDRHLGCRDLLLRIVSMLTNMVRALHRRAQPGTGTGTGTGTGERL